MLKDNLKIAFFWFIYIGTKTNPIVMEHQTAILPAANSRIFPNSTTEKPPARTWLAYNFQVYFISILRRGLLLLSRNACTSVRIQIEKSEQSDLPRNDPYTSFGISLHYIQQDAIHLQTITTCITLYIVSQKNNHTCCFRLTLTLSVSVCRRLKLCFLCHYIWNTSC